MEGFEAPSFFIFLIYKFSERFFHFFGLLGGTMINVLTDIINRGADSSNIRIISAIAAPPALNKLNEAFPGLKIYTAIIDAELNDKGFIVPGMGDAGDRAYGNI